MLNKNIRKILIYLLVVIVGFTGYKLWGYYQHQEATKLRIDEFEKIEYDSVESLVKRIDTVDFTDDVYAPSHYDVINNYIYTITEDKIVDEFHEVIYSYNFENFRGNQAWLIYDMAVNNQYCYYKEIDLKACYINDNEIKSSEKMTSEPFRYLLFNLQVMNVDSTTGGDYPKYYSTELSDLFLEAIDNAYIISQGPDTPGYEEAMKWSYDLAKDNGNRNSYSEFSDSYAKFTRVNIDSLKELRNMNIVEIVTRYDDYALFLYDIDAYIRMAAPSK